MIKNKKDSNQEKQNIEQANNESENINQDSNDEQNQLELSRVKITELETQVKEWNDKFLRKAAEFENYKRRTENDQFNLISYAAESFITKLLPIVDDFERSMEHIDDIDNNKSVKDGIKLVYEKLLKLLSDNGVKKMKAKGEPFNVDFHDALMQRKDDSVPPHTVIEEVEAGYYYRDKVIRHAKVIVSEESSNFQAPNDNSTNSSAEKEN